MAHQATVMTWHNFTLALHIEVLVVIKEVCHQARSGRAKWCTFCNIRKCEKKTYGDFKCQTTLVDNRLSSFVRVISDYTTRVHSARLKDF